MKKLTYTAKDIAKILNVSTPTGYDVLRKLQAQFKQDNPDSIVIKRCIPAQYFEKKILGIERKE